MRIVILLIILIIPINVNAISASSAIVMDQSSNRILYSNNISEKKLIASTTKIMTAIITIEYADLNKEVIVDDCVLKAYGSAIYIEVGEKLKIKDLLYGLMLRSGNDAAIVLAKEVAGTMENFAYLMNQKAMDIGMKNTIFINNHGLENSDGEGNMSTAYDMAVLTSYAMKNTTFKEIFGTKKYILKTNYKTYSWTNKNKILHSTEFITGGKTGFTEKARRTLVTTASKDNKDLIVVTLNDGNDFSDHLALYNKYFDMYESVKMIDKNNFQIQDNYYKNVKFRVKNSYYALVTEKEKKDLSLKVKLIKERNIQNHAWVGTISVYLKDELLHKENIFIQKKSSNKNLGFWTRIKGWFND